MRCQYTGLRIKKSIRPKSFVPRPRANIKEAIQFQKACLRFFPVNSFVSNTSFVPQLCYEQHFWYFYIETFLNVFKRFTKLLKRLSLRTEKSNNKVTCRNHIAAKHAKLARPPRQPGRHGSKSEANNYHHFSDEKDLTSWS